MAPSSISSAGGYSSAGGLSFKLGHSLWDTRGQQTPMQSWTGLESVRHSHGSRPSARHSVTIAEASTHCFIRAVLSSSPHAASSTISAAISTLSNMAGSSSSEQRPRLAWLRHSARQTLTTGESMMHSQCVPLPSTKHLKTFGSAGTHSFILWRSKSAPHSPSMLAMAGTGAGGGGDGADSGSAGSVCAMAAGTAKAARQASKTRKPAIALPVCRSA